MKNAIGKRLSAILILTACLIPRIGAASPAPVVVYHFAGGWNGYPPNPATSGWHALALTATTRGADTGVMAYLSKWDARHQCWGSLRDCRSPAWAKQQGLSYIGAVDAPASRIVVEIRQ